MSRLISFYSTFCIWFFFSLFQATNSLPVVSVSPCCLALSLLCGKVDESHLSALAHCFLKRESDVGEVRTLLTLGGCK